MIRFERTALPKIGRMPQALQWARAFAGFMKERYGVEVRVFTESSGRLHWHADYTSWDAFGSVRQASVTDSDYWGHIGRAADIFVEGTLQDTLLILVE
jgi:hypothetical protein